QVRGLSPASGKRDRARPKGRTASYSAGFSLRSCPWPLARGRSSSQPGSSRYPRPGASRPGRNGRGGPGSRAGRWPFFCRSLLTSLEFRDRLARRARRAKAPVTLAMLDPLEAYFRLLTHWNAKINLTALPLDEPTDETFDRLLVEPLAASKQIPDRQ